MNAHLILGFFAFYVVAVTLYRVLAGSDDSRLELVRRIWGRTRGLGLYFSVNVALPLLVGVLCLGQGVANFGMTAPGLHPPASSPDLYRLQIDTAQAMEALRQLTQHLDFFVLSP